MTSPFNNSSHISLSIRPFHLPQPFSQGPSISIKFIPSIFLPSPVGYHSPAQRIIYFVVFCISTNNIVWLWRFQRRIHTCKGTTPLSVIIARPSSSISSTAAANSGLRVYLRSPSKERLFPTRYRRPLCMPTTHTIKVGIEIRTRGTRCLMFSPFYAIDGATYIPNSALIHPYWLYRLYAPVLIPVFLSAHNGQCRDGYSSNEQCLPCAVSVRSLRGEYP